MKKLVGGMLVAVIALTGCTKESKPGVPGAKTTPPRTVERSYKSPDDTPADKADTFTLTVPTEEAGIKGGEHREVTIMIDRGDAFNQQVKLQFQAPAGLTVTPSEAVLNAGEKEVTVDIHAAEDAPLGDVNIQVIGLPETRKPVSMQMKMEIKK